MIIPIFVNPENSTYPDFSKMNNSIDLNTVNYLQKELLTQKNNKNSFYIKENEVEDDSVCSAKNFIPSYEESPNFLNNVSLKKEPKEAKNHIDINSGNKKEDEIATKIINVFDFSGENNGKDDNNELNSLNSKETMLKDKNKSSNDSDILGETVAEIIISNEIIGNDTNSYSLNKKSRKKKAKWQNLEIDYGKKFQLFSKGTNNPYVNEIINSINNEKNKSKKRSKKLFKICNYENGVSVKLIGRKRKKQKRCEKPDDIRKKLKSRFHKIFTQKINDNLKAVNSEKKFYLMPQIFISNIAKKQNKEVMNMKLKDLLRKNFIEDYKEYKSKSLKANIEKYLKNLHTLYYLEKNIDIQEKCKFNIIGEMKYFEMLEEFFYSKEFEDTVIKESQKKPFEYVKDYVEKARTYVKFFLCSDSD